MDFECYDSSKHFWKKDEVLFYVEIMPLLVLLGCGMFRAIYSMEVPQVGNKHVAMVHEPQCGCC